VQKLKFIKKLASFAQVTVQTVPELKVKMLFPTHSKHTLIGIFQSWLSKPFPVISFFSKTDFRNGGKNTISMSSLVQRVCAISTGIFAALQKQISGASNNVHWGYRSTRFLQAVVINAGLRNSKTTLNNCIRSKMHFEKKFSVFDWHWDTWETVGFLWRTFFYFLAYANFTYITLYICFSSTEKKASIAH